MERPRQRHAGLRQHLPACRFYEMFQQTDLAGQVRHRHLLRAAPADIKGEETGEGADREAAPVRHLPQDAGRPLQRARRHGDVQGRAVREGGQEAVHRRAGADEAADRRRQAADRLRRAAAPPTSTSTRRCRTTACSRRSAGSTGSTARTRTTATSSTTRTCSSSLEQSIKDYTGEAFDGYDKADIEGLLEGPARAGHASDWRRRAKRSRRCASRSSRRRTPRPTCATSALPRAATPSSSRTTSPSASRSTS